MILQLGAWWKPQLGRFAASLPGSDSVLPLLALSQLSFRSGHWYSTDNFTFSLILRLATDIKGTAHVYSLRSL